MQTTERRAVEPVHPAGRRGEQRSAPWPVAFYRSAVGKKWVMALTGIALMGFVFFHMIGNLKVYFGAPDFNHYGEFLRELFVPLLPRTVFLWLIRTVLVVSFIFHIHSAYGLTRMNQRARGDGYVQARDWQAADIAGRTMRWTGVIIALFLLFHLADLTWGTVNPDFVRGDVYRNFVASLSRPAVSVIYIVANVALGLHLWHGAWSMFQSLGLNNPRWNSWRRSFAIGFAVIVAGVNISFPIAVLTGVVNDDDCIKSGDVIETCANYTATADEAGR
jgi:succinate dehydrogenase / fumarate reductase cytochrome b subunit